MYLVELIPRLLLEIEASAGLCRKLYGYCSHDEKGTEDFFGVNLIRTAVKSS